MQALRDCNIVTLKSCSVAFAFVRATSANHTNDSEGIRTLWAEPNGFLVHHLNHSVTLSCGTAAVACSLLQHTPASVKPLPTQGASLQLQRLRRCGVQ